MNQEIKISATQTVATIDIEGVIGSEQLGDAVTSYNSLREKLQQIEQLQSPVVVVNIRSVGGDVADALLIYEALCSLDAHITTRCYGYTASAATIIAQAANEGCREMAASALYLIHNCSCVVEGNALDLKEQAELLQKTDERIAAIYAARSDKGADYYTELMAQNNGNGVWLSPEQAVDAGLVDTIVTAESGVTASLLTRLAEWLGIKNKKAEKSPTLPTDSVTFRPQSVTCSQITLSEGQKSVKRSSVKSTEDPGLQGEILSANAEAYSRDASIFRN